MRTFLAPALIAGFVLLLISAAILFTLVNLFPELAMEYYNPIFRAEDDRNWMFYVHPFVLSLALSWFWSRFKSLFQGSVWLRGLELGLVYLVVATIPTMWITFSAIDVSAGMVFTWVLYGFVQSVIAGWILAWRNP